jgi:hypothetical protein
MEIEGVVHNGVIVPDDATALPEGTRVRITPEPVEEPKSFGERFAQFKGAVPGLPADLAGQTPVAGTPGTAAALLAAVESSPRVPAAWVDELEQLIAAGRRPPTQGDPFQEGQ